MCTLVRAHTHTHMMAIFTIKKRQVSYLAKQRLKWCKNISVSERKFAKNILSIFKITACWRKDRGGRLPSKVPRKSVFQNHKEDKAAVLTVVHDATEGCLSGSLWTASLGRQVSAHCPLPWSSISACGSAAQQWNPPASTSGLISLLTEDVRKL